MSDKKQLDIAIVIALKEEFKECYDKLGLVPCADIAPKYGEWYTWTFQTTGGVARTAVCSFIGHLGPPHALQYTERFLSAFAPAVLVNFGLSGMANGDALLGDIVYASETDLYDDDSAISEKAGEIEPQWSGTPIQTADFKKAIENFEFQHRTEYASVVSHK